MTNLYKHCYNTKLPLIFLFMKDFFIFNKKQLQYNNLSQSWPEKTQGHLVPTMNGSHNEF